MRKAKEAHLPEFARVRAGQKTLVGRKNYLAFQQVFPVHVTGQLPCSIRVLDTFTSHLFLRSRRLQTWRIFCWRWIVS